MRAPTSIVALIEVNAATATSSASSLRRRRPESARDDVRRRRLARREARRAQAREQRHVDDDVDDSHDRDAGDQRRHDRATSAVQLGRDVRGLVPAAVGEQHEDHREAEESERWRRREDTRSPGAARPGVAPGPAHEAGTATHEPRTSTHRQQVLRPRRRREAHELTTVSARRSRPQAADRGPAGIARTM